MATFTEIPASFPASIATDGERVPTLYFSGNPAVRRIFWLRLRWIFTLAKRYARAHGSCLDFAPGGGVFLPSLASLFSHVVAVDLKTREAAQVVDRFDLENVTLVREDVTEARLERRRWFVPFRVRLLPLYLVTAWRKDPAGARERT